MNGLEIRIKLEAFISERLAMQAANQLRADQGQSQAYGEESFFGNAEDMRNLLKELRPTEVNNDLS